MYLTRREVMVRAGSTAEFEATSSAYFKLLGGQPGFLRATLLNSLGFPARYTRLVQWLSREEARAFYRSPQAAENLREQEAQNLSVPSRQIEAYEVIHRVIGSGEPVAAYLIDEIVRPGATTSQEFEESRGAIYQLRRQFGPGFAASLLSRFLGGANRYLIFGGFAADGDDRRTGETAEIVRYWEEHPDAQKLVTSAVRDPQSLVLSATAQHI